MSELTNSVDLAVGIYAGGSRNQQSLTEIQKQINTFKQYGYAIFPWKTSLGLLRWSDRQQKEKYLEAI